MLSAPIFSPDRPQCSCCVGKGRELPPKREQHWIYLLVNLEDDTKQHMVPKNNNGQGLEHIFKASDTKRASPSELFVEFARFNFRSLLTFPEGGCVLRQRSTLGQRTELGSRHTAADSRRSPVHATERWCKKQSNSTPLLYSALRWEAWTAKTREHFFSLGSFTSIRFI